MSIVKGKVEHPIPLPSGWIGCYKRMRRLKEEVEVEVKVPASSASEGKLEKEVRKALKGTGRLRDPKTGEWVEVGRLRKIMG